MKKDKLKTDKSSVKEKSPLPLRILSGIKRVILRLCGKARWLLLGIAVIIFIPIFNSWNYPIGKFYEGTRNEKNIIEPVSRLRSIDQFSVNSSGTAAVMCDIGINGMCGIVDIDTGAQSYANNTALVTDAIHNEVLFPYNLTVTDSGIIYAVSSTSLGDDNSFITSETIVRISDKYEYLGNACEIKYSETDYSRTSKLTGLHYYDGAVTFAVVEKSGVRLYSIDTETQALTTSDVYPTDADGTYTFCVIPLDGSFLFLRSDGNVYRTSFGEPLGESIYRFDMNGDNYCFTQAVQVGERLCVFDEKHPYEVYCLENGSLKKAADIRDLRGEDGSVIKYIASYRPADTGEDTLVICLDNGILTYSGGKFTEKDITLSSGKYFAMYAESFLNVLFYLLILGLIINLVIRKKTLLFKQLAVVIPTLFIISLKVTGDLCDYFVIKENRTITKDLSIICEMGTAEFEGYDFSPLLETNENTGDAYRQLSGRLEELSNERLRKWSGEYVFSVIYRTGDGDDLLLSQNDKLCLPMYTADDTVKSAENENTDELQVVNNVNDLLSGQVRSSSIIAMKRIKDSKNSGNIILKVSTEDKSFWMQRRDFILKVWFICILIFTIITALIVIMSVYITRNINKAKKAVEKIAEGDLSARIKYRSKDELGEICSKVNDMGQSLETLFKEKDKTESFYYKFVPEQFRRLLGKESFTDLSLGDASSRELTVLFCDIRSFSINSEMMTAKENFSFVNIIYGKAGPIIRENNGFIDKYIGDAVMALFENAEDAVKAGTELYRAIVLDPHTAEELNVRDINIGIGIHTGMAMIGIVGESERLSGTVISDTVNLSSRLETLTKQYKTGMLISKDTVDRIAEPEALGLRYLGMIQVAGVNEVKAVYEVLGCLSDEQRKKRSANISELREAIRLFHLGRRAEALSELKALADKGMNDHVTDMYLEYISNLPDEDSGNVFRFIRK